MATRSEGRDSKEEDRGKDNTNTVPLSNSFKGLAVNIDEENTEFMFGQSVMLHGLSMEKVPEIPASVSLMCHVMMLCGCVQRY